MKMTVEKIKSILTKEIIQNLEKDKGITEFYNEGNLSLGISFETGDVNDGEEAERYILNVFFESEYFNVEYIPGNHGLNDLVFQDLADVWNKNMSLRQRNNTSCI